MMAMRFHPALDGVPLPEESPRVLGCMLQIDRLYGHTTWDALDQLAASLSASEELAVRWYFGWYADDSPRVPLHQIAARLGVGSAQTLRVVRTALFRMFAMAKEEGWCVQDFWAPESMPDRSINLSHPTPTSEVTA